MSHSGSSSSGSAEVAAGVTGKSYSLNASDTCAWHGGVACDSPRSCYDCLNVLLDSGEQVSSSLPMSHDQLMIDD